MKKVVSLFLCLGLMVCNASAIWFDNSVAILKDSDIIVKDYNIQDNRYISRIDFITLICRAKGLKVDSDDRYDLRYQKVALDNGIIEDTNSDLNFLAGTISRFEACKLLYENNKDSLNVENIDILGDYLLDYKGIPNDYLESVMQLYVNGIVTGNSNQMFNGWDALTVGEAVTLIDRMYFIEHRVKPNLSEYKYLLGEYTTYTTNEANRNFNVKKAADTINGYIIEPHKQFSYNAIIGNAGKTEGYKTANVISGGKYVKGYGGGICQDATTLFNAALLANLQIDERHAHGLKSTYIKPGWDATVYYGSLDLKFTNIYDFPIKIVAYFDSSVNGVTFKLYGTEDVDLSGINLYVIGQGRNWTLYRENNGEVNYKTASVYKK